MRNKSNIVIIITLILGLHCKAAAQVWNNNSGGVNAYKGGAKSEVRMTGSKTNTSDIHGTILGIGENNASRIPYKVVWAKAKEAGVVQNVQGDLFFTNLWLEGSNKLVQTVNVSGYYNAGDSVSPENISYAGRFTYDGDGDIVLQKIAPAYDAVGNNHVANAYDTLILSKISINNTKQIPAVSGKYGQVYVRGQLNVMAGIGLVNDGDLTLIPNDEGTKSYIDGSLVVNETGTFNIRTAANPASFVVDEDTLAIGAAGSVVINSNVAGNRYYDANNFNKAGFGMAGGRLEVFGLLENANAAKNNINLVNWNAPYPASTVAYYGADQAGKYIMPTLCDYPYGRLEMANDILNPATIDRKMNSNTYVLGNTKQATVATTVDDSTFVFSAATGGTFSSASGMDTLVFIAGSATYHGNGLGEVAGWIKHRDCNNNAGNIVVGKEYVLHNDKTRIVFNTTATLFEYFAMQSLPNTVPSKKMPDDDTLHINRQIQLDYKFSTVPADHSTMAINKLQLGYRTSEILAATPAGKEEVVNNLKMDEGWMLTGGYIPAGQRTQAIRIKDNATGMAVSPVRDAYGSGDLLGITLQANGSSDRIRLRDDGTAPGDINDIYTNSQIVLNAAPNVIISINSGRWSNPATWDIGETPRAADSVIIEHQIYTGLWINSMTDLFGVKPYPKAEDKLLTDSPAEFTEGNILAKHVTIRPNATSGKNSALIIGNSVASASGAEVMDFNKILAFGRTCTNGINVITPNMPSVPIDFTINDATDPAKYEALSGLYIMTQIGSTDAPVIRATNLFNSGVTTNNAIIEIGN